MPRRRTNAGYSKLRTEEIEKDEADGFVDEQFRDDSPRNIPWKTIIFIVSFMVAGAICLCLGILISTGYIEKKYEDRAWPLFILGILMFIPGSYYGYILFWICLKREGFTFDEIPAF